MDNDITLNYRRLLVMGFKMQALIVLAMVVSPCLVGAQFNNLYYGYTPGELEEFIGRTVSLKTERYVK